MATLEQLSTALVNADAAGDVQAARTLAAEISKMRSGGQAEQPEQEKSTLQNIRETMGASISGIGQGATFGLQDELFAGLETPFRVAAGAITGSDEGKGIGDRISGAYGRGLDEQRGLLKERQEQSPIASTVGEIAGGAVTAGGLAKGGVTLLNAAKPTVASMVGRGAGEGAAYGGLYGFGTGEGAGDRLERTAMGAGLGALTGGAVGGVGAGMAQRQVSKSLPTREALHQRAQQLYDVAENANVVVSPTKYATAVKNIVQEVSTEGIDLTLHPRAVAALKRMDELSGQPVSFKTLDVMRRVAKGAAASPEPDERRIASIIVDKFDDFMTGLKQSDVISGDPRTATNAIVQARDLWQRMRKVDVIDDMIERARSRAGQFSQSGMENALRTEFRQLAMNKKRMRGFSKAEADAIKRVAQGGTVENLLRLVGKAAPRGVVSGGFGVGAGAIAGDPLVGGGVMALGELSKRSAGAMTQRNVTRAADLARAGGTIPSPQRLTAAQRSLLDAILATEAQKVQSRPAAPFSMAR